jgi:hypothetical protein
MESVVGVHSGSESLSRETVRRRLAEDDLKVTDHRAACDFAHCVRDLADAQGVK